MRILTVVGARPQFIKAAVVSKELRKVHTEILLHTGQHFDYNMSERFFEELEIPRPDYNLGISGGTHGEMTGRMLISIEKVLIKEKPDWLLVYGDTNSTLAASLAAAKLHIPICHVEAGTRTHCRTNPEEMNRICTDHLSTLLLVSTQSGIDELTREGLQKNAFLVGDTMYDAFLAYRDAIMIEELRLTGLDGDAVSVPKTYYYLTCHREENTDDDSLKEIFKAMEKLDAKVVYPVHPRNKKRALRTSGELQTKNIILSEPVGYLESLCLVNHAKKIITDSGGLQREAFFAEKKCVTILDFVVWPETMVDNRNQLSAANADEIIKKLSVPQRINPESLPFGDGRASKRIVDCIIQQELGGI